MSPSSSTTAAGARRHADLRSTGAQGLLLLLLAAASFGASYLPLGAWALPLALAFALAKALVVLLFFMELARERASVVLAFIAGLAMLLFMLTFVVADLVTRRP